MSAHGRFQFGGNRLYGNNFFLIDADDVVIKRRTLNDAYSRPLYISGFIHYHRRIARPRSNQALVGDFAGSLHHRLTAGNGK